MNYAVEQRMRFIDFLLAQYGHINRAALMDYFGIGSACATRDFKAYKELNPDGIWLNDSDKNYYKTVAFKRVWPEG